MAVGLDGDQGACGKRLFKLAQGAAYALPHCFRGDVLDPKLDNAGRAAFGAGEDRAEVQIVGKKHVGTVRTPAENFAVGGRCRSDFRPVSRLKSP